MSIVSLTEAAREVLDGSHTAVLAGARPQSSVIFVKREGGHVLFSTIEGRLKSRNLRRDSRVSLLVAGNPGRYVEIRGRAADRPDRPGKGVPPALGGVRTRRCVNRAPPWPVYRGDDRRPAARAGDHPCTTT